MAASTVPPGTHTAFFSLKPATAVPCGPAVTSLRPTMTSTTLIAISSSCLRTLTLRPLCLRASLRLMSYTLSLVADSPWTYSRFRSDIHLHLFTSHFLTTLSSPHSEHWLHKSATFFMPANWLGPRSFQFSSIMCALDCNDYLLNTLSLREAGTCATRS